MGCVSRRLLVGLVLFTAVPAAVALDRTELDQRYQQAMAVGHSLSLEATDDSKASPAEPITRALLAGDPTVFVAIGQQGFQAVWAVPTLRQLLKHRTAQLRMISIRTLGQIGPAAAAATGDLEAAASVPVTAAAARTALKQITGEDNQRSAE